MMSFRSFSIFLIFSLLVFGLTGCPGSVVVNNSMNQPAANRSPNSNAANAAVTADSEAGGKSEVTVLADGRDQPKDVKPTAGEQAFADKAAEIVKNAGVECDDTPANGVQIVGMIDGSFTKAGAAQRAYLYERCRAGRSFGIGGLIIADGQSVAAHYQFGEGGLFDEIRKTPDVNRDGTDEIVLIGGGTGQGYTSSTLFLTEFPGGEFRSLGETDLYNDNSGAEMDETKVLTTAYRITAVPGKSPEFLRDTFEKKGNAKEWKSVKTQETVKMETAEPLKMKKVV